MATDDTEYPTVGKESGETVAGTSPDDSGDVLYVGPDSTEELLEKAGISDNGEGEMTRPLGKLGGEVEEEELLDDEESIRRRLPEGAELLPDGRLRAENNRNYGGYDYFNQKRRVILRELDDGSDPLDIVDEYDFADSYVYRTRIVLGFLIDDPLLKKEFIEDGGEFAPAHDPQNEEETMTPEEHQEEKRERLEEATVPLEEAREMAENAYENGLEEGRGEATISEPESDTELFEGDEWWDIMKTLMNNGHDDYARRIASEMDFN